MKNQNYNSLTMNDIYEIMSNITIAPPSPDKPVTWMQGPYTFQNDGLKLKIQLNNGDFFPITTEEYTLITNPTESPYPPELDYDEPVDDI